MLSSERNPDHLLTPDDFQAYNSELVLQTFPTWALFTLSAERNKHNSYTATNTLLTVTRYGKASIPQHLFVQFYYKLSTCKVLMMLNLYV